MTREVQTDRKFLRSTTLNNSSVTAIWSPFGVRVIDNNLHTER